MSLSPKQARFVEEYLVDLNATQAAIRAGYSARTAKAIGAENLTKPDVAAAITAARTARAQRVELTQDYVVDTLTEVVERCMERAPVMVRAGREFVQLVDDEGRDVWRFDAKGANGALKLLGEHLGMYKKHLKVEATVRTRPGRLTPEERAAFLRDMLAAKDTAA